MTLRVRTSNISPANSISLVTSRAIGLTKVPKVARPAADTIHRAPVSRETERTDIPVDWTN